MATEHGHAIRIPNITMSAGSEMRFRWEGVTVSVFGGEEDKQLEAFIRIRKALPVNKPNDAPKVEEKQIARKPAVEPELNEAEIDEYEDDDDEKTSGYVKVVRRSARNGDTRGLVNQLKKILSGSEGLMIVDIMKQLKPVGFTVDKKQVHKVMYANKSVFQVEQVSEPDDFGIMRDRKYWSLVEE